MKLFGEHSEVFPDLFGALDSKLHHTCKPGQFETLFYDNHNEHHGLKQQVYIGCLISNKKKVRDNKI
jgi:hypothetical protein